MKEMGLLIAAVCVSDKHCRRELYLRNREEVDIIEVLLSLGILTSKEHHECSVFLLALFLLPDSLVSLLQL